MTLLPSGEAKPGLRVLHIDAGREWRGGQRQVHLLATGLREMGHEPLVVTPPGTPLHQRLRAAGIAVAAVPMRNDWDLLAVRRLRRLIRTWEPALVHAHDARGHALALGALVGRRAAPPLIVTRRVPFRPKGKLKYGARVAQFIAISEAVREALVAGGVDRARIALVYSGVPMPPAVTPRDWRAECGWPPQVVLGGLVGAMTAEKGLDALTQVLESLPRDVASQLRLVLLGGTAAGTDRIGGVEVFRAGFIHEVHAAMAGLDLLLHPSAAEGLGTAVIDAMALGVPPVAFAVGGLPELIEHDRSGLLVAAGDTAAFAAAVARLVGDPAARHRLSAAGRPRAQLFDAHQMVTGVAEVYRHLLERSGV